jgi:hypothetical protein
MGGIKPAKTPKPNCERLNRAIRLVPNAAHVLLGRLDAASAIDRERQWRGCIEVGLAGWLCHGKGSIRHNRPNSGGSSPLLQEAHDSVASGLLWGGSPE